MKTVYFKLANPTITPGQMWEVAFTQNPGNPDINNWTFTGFQTLDKTIKATMPDGALWVAFYIGLIGTQADGVAYQESVNFVNNATYIWDDNLKTLTRGSAGVPPSEPGGGGLMDTLNKYAVPISIGAVLLGVVLTRKRN